MAVDEQNWKIPEWWYREKRPPNDDAYFENMCRVIFQSGLNWRVIEDKWPTTKKAFANFEVPKVAYFSDADVENLMKDFGIVRNKGKIKAIIQNSQNFSHRNKMQFIPKIPSIVCFSHLVGIFFANT
jgi:3-methyladenine DNA glycosylase Tag